VARETAEAVEGRDQAWCEAYRKPAARGIGGAATVKAAQRRPSMAAMQATIRTA
jgi:hypothetical protein